MHTHTGTHTEAHTHAHTHGACMHTHMHTLSSSWVSHPLTGKCLNPLQVLRGTGPGLIPTLLLRVFQHLKTNSLMTILNLRHMRSLIATKIN